MTINQIKKAQIKDNVKFELAAKIREMLDAAKKAYGASDWVDDDVEASIGDLVFSE